MSIIVGFRREINIKNIRLHPIVLGELAYTMDRSVVVWAIQNFVAMLKFSLTFSAP